MPIRLDTVIYVPAKEAGSEAKRSFAIDPFPNHEGEEAAVRLPILPSGRVVEIAELRAALDAAERIQKEDGR